MDKVWLVIAVGHCNQINKTKSRELTFAECLQNLVPVGDVVVRHRNVTASSIIKAIIECCFRYWLN